MAYLTLCDGTVYEGESFGYIGDSMGEVVSNTAMTGYQELITHPASYGQLINMTYPLIGNYGVNKKDSQSDCVYARGLIVKDYCKDMSNWRAEESLSDYLIQHRVVGIHSVDTRSLCKKLRNSQETRGLITQNKATSEQIQMLNDCILDNPISAVSTKVEYEIMGDPSKRVGIIDYGLSRSLLDSVTKLGYTVKVFPYNSLADSIKKYNPQGIILSDGAKGNSSCQQEINTIKALLSTDIAILGIGLGHLLLALAKGAKICRLNNGHRGANQPIKELLTNRLYTTVQNHAYAIEELSLLGIGQVTHTNCNDSSVEGVDYGKIHYSLQFEPKEVIGPQNTAHLFDKFRRIVEN